MAALSARRRPESSPPGACLRSKVGTALAKPRPVTMLRPMLPAAPDAVAAGAAAPGVVLRRRLLRAHARARAHARTRRLRAHARTHARARARARARDNWGS